MVGAIVGVGAVVAVGGTGVLVGAGVAVAVAVGGTGVLVGAAVGVGGGVAVGTGVAVGCARPGTPHAERSTTSEKMAKRAKRLNMIPPYRTVRVTVPAVEPSLRTIATA